jgi:hypothetical protein
VLKPATDPQWEQLLDPSGLYEAQKSAEKHYEHQTTDKLQYLRKRCKTDLLFLTNVLGYNKTTARLHGHLSWWLDSTIHEQFRIILMPRGHYKTTVDTITDSVRITLPAGDLSPPEPHNLGPEVRILLCHETHEGASRFLYEITHHFMRNPQLIGLFPELVPNSRKHRMNKFELELPRKGHYAEPTFDTLGVGGKAQGRHYNVIKLDDIFGDKARDSKAERDTTIQWFDNIQSFAIDLSTIRLDLIGTRYSLDDVYSHAMNVYGPKLIRYIRRIEEPDENGLPKSIFPEGGFDSDYLQILRKNPRVWSAQYCNDPQEGLAEFDPTWKRFYYWSAPTRIAFFSGQLSTTYNVRSDLDITILCDPAVTGLPGIVVTGVSPKLQVFVLEAIKKPMKPPEFVELMFGLVQKYWPRLVSVEDVVFSSVYQSWLEREMQVRNCRFNIVPWRPPKGIKKDTRIARRLSNYFSAGQIFFSENQTDLIWEFENFGATVNTHLLDALAQGPDVWRPGLDAKTWSEYHKAEELLLADRDPLTGYGVL